MESGLVGVDDKIYISNGINHSMYTYSLEGLKKKTQSEDVQKKLLPVMV